MNYQGPYQLIPNIYSELQTHFPGFSECIAVFTVKMSQKNSYFVMHLNSKHADEASDLIVLSWCSRPSRTVIFPTGLNSEHLCCFITPYVDFSEWPGHRVRFPKGNILPFILLLLKCTFKLKVISLDPQRSQSFPPARHPDIYNSTLIMLGPLLAWPNIGSNTHSCCSKKKKKFFWIQKWIQFTPGRF